MGGCDHHPTRRRRCRGECECKQNTVVSKWSRLAAAGGAPRVGQPGWACGHARLPCTPPWREPGVKNTVSRLASRFQIRQPVHVAADARLDTEGERRRCLFGTLLGVASRACIAHSPPYAYEYTKINPPADCFPAFRCCPLPVRYVCVCVFPRRGSPRPHGRVRRQRCAYRRARDPDDRDALLPPHGGSAAAATCRVQRPRQLRLQRYHPPRHRHHPLLRWAHSQHTRKSRIEPWSLSSCSPPHAVHTRRANRRLDASSRSGGLQGCEGFGRWHRRAVG